MLKFCISLRETFSTKIVFTGINKYGKGAVVQIWTVFWPVSHVTCGRVLWNGTFLDIYLTTFFRVRKFNNTFKLWRQSFFWKISKLNRNLENGKKNLEHIFRSLDDWIIKRCHKLFLLRRKYLLSNVNGLTNSPRILPIIPRNFLNLNCLQRDESRW